MNTAPETDRTEMTEMTGLTGSCLPGGTCAHAPAVNAVPFNLVYLHEPVTHGDSSNKAYATRCAWLTEVPCKSCHAGMPDYLQFLVG